LCILPFQCSYRVAVLPSISWYGKDVYLLLHKTLYGLKQAAHRFSMYLLKIVRGLKFTRSKADPCLYFRWTDTNTLLLWFSWVDDCFITGPQMELMQNEKGHHEWNGL
jgi:hypothetical protein